MIGVAPDYASVWAARALVLIAQGRLEAADDANSIAIKYDLSQDSLVQRAWLMILMGRPNDALSTLDEASEVNPAVGQGYLSNVYRCAALAGLGHYHEAASLCERAAERGDHCLVDLILVAAYALDGDTSKMAREKAKLLELRPGFTIANLQSIDRNLGAPAYYQMAEAHLYKGLREAGIPER